jgi:hypothetical protein
MNNLNTALPRQIERRCANDPGNISFQIGQLLTNLARVIAVVMGLL